jgi:hypothetical protein
MTRLTALRLVLWAIAIYHVVLGVGAFLSPDLAQQIAKSIFGIEIVLDPAMAFVVKVLGVYAITFGIVAVVAARDPARYRVLLDVIVVLYAMRIATKLLFKSQAIAGLDVGPTRIWVEAALLAGFGLAVLLLRPRPEVSAAPR